jgi:hypothetical protein
VNSTTEKTQLQALLGQLNEIDRKAAPYLNMNQLLDKCTNARGDFEHQLGILCPPDQAPSSLVIPVELRAACVLQNYPAINWDPFKQDKTELRRLIVQKLTQ